MRWFLLAALLWPATAAADCFYKSFSGSLVPVTCPEAASYPAEFPPIPKGAVWAQLRPGYWKALPVWRSGRTGSEHRSGNVRVSFGRAEEPRKEVPRMSSAQLPEFREPMVSEAPSSCYWYDLYGAPNPIKCPEERTEAGYNLLPKVPSNVVFLKVRKPGYGEPTLYKAVRISRFSIGVTPLRLNKLPDAAAFDKPQPAVELMGRKFRYVRFPDSDRPDGALARQAAKGRQCVFTVQINPGFQQGVPLVDSFDRSRPGFFHRLAGVCPEDDPTQNHVISKMPGHSYFTAEDGSMPFFRYLVPNQLGGKPPAVAQAPAPSARAAPGAAPVPSAPLTLAALGLAGALQGANQIQAAEFEGDAAASMKRAGEALSRRNFDAAAASASAAIRAQPSAAAYLLRATAYNGAGRFGEAAADAETGAALPLAGPEGWMLAQARCYALARLGNAADALRACDTAVKGGASSGAYADRAYVYHLLGDRARMLEDLKQAGYTNEYYALRADEKWEPFNTVPPRPMGGRGTSPLFLVFLALAAGGLGFGGARFLAEREAAADKPKAPTFAPTLSIPMGDAATIRQVTPPTIVGAAQAAPLSPAPGGVPLLRGRYELKGKIGAGGMGVVYEGFDHSLGRRIAVKQMRPEIKNAERERQVFLSEARIISHLSHPYIVAIHEVVEEAGEIYIVFDYVDGKPLSQLLVEKKRLALPECKKLFSYVCEAVACAHKAHVMHRDLKPANIMVDSQGYAKVMDFGIAREAKETITRMTRTDTSGTPAYMAPEQHLGRGGKASDVYALGVCLYEALTGTLPFPGPDFLAQKERMKHPPPQFLAPDLPKESEALFASVLAADPKSRVGDVEAFAAALQKI